MVWGSTLILKLLEKFPATLYIGAGVLALTAGKMMVGENFVKAWIGTGFLKWTIVVLVVVGVMGAGYAIKKSRANKAVDGSRNGSEPSKAS
jgi:predicted tellurium resistance membrane protein TerC